MRDARFWLALAALAVGPALRAEPPATVRPLLEKHCAACHGSAGKGKGGFDYVLNHAALVARGQVQPGRADTSPLWQRVAAGEMPPPGKPPLTDAEKASLRAWIADGAKDWAPAVAVATLVPAEVSRLVRADLDAVEPRQRRFQRYVSFAHLAPLANAADLLTTHRLALTKLANALSWSARLVPPTPIDPGRLVYRLDLRDYRWNPRVWDRLALLSPYPAASDLPLVRGDWFVATASRPPFYYDFLQLPSTEKGLERLLQVDAPADLAEDRVARAGFTGSGVARHNRVLQRHDSIFGAYWRSFDFLDNLGRQNVFEAPLGPAGRGNGFQHDGGEMIFGLPNGLHGYFVTDAAGRRLDKAPVEVVSDPKRPDKAVEVGVSCFSCHTQGYLPKDDMVRARVLRDAKTFPAEERDQALAWYVPAAKFKALMDEDNARYRKAVAALGLPASGDDPIEAAVLRYEAVLDAPSAAAELGLAPEVFVRYLGENADLRKTLGALLAPGGSVPRIVWEEEYADVTRSLATKPAVALVPPTGHAGAIRAIAKGPGDRLITGGEDRLALVWNAETLTPTRRLEGHTAEVVAVAFRNGREALTASLDRTVRLWDVATGKEVRRFEGATDRLRTLAVTPNGQYVFAAGDDRVIRGWDVVTGREVYRFEGHADAVLALAVDPTGGTLASTGRDATVRRWELVRGTEIARLDTGSYRPLRALAHSPDGTRLAFGGESKTATLVGRDGRQLWERATGPNAVVHVAFLGGSVVVGSSQYRTEDALVRVLSARTGDIEATLSGVGLGRVEALLVEERDGGVQVVVAQGEKLRRVALTAGR